MESRELRIGNIVNCEYHYNDCPNPKKFNAPIEIESIRRDSVTLSTFQDVEIEYLSGIPLTEEWLLRFGFSKFLNQYTLITSVHKKDFKNIPFIVLYLDNKFEYDDLRFRTNLKYVNQLQNLYFALTGEELTTQELNQ
jgi:hypothetical protein